MARHPPTRRRTAPDLISQLPEDVKHRILECLDAREAAKTALLSTLWNEVWLRHGRLVFDWDSLAEGRGLKRSKMIYSALLLRSAPVKIFTLYIVHWEPSLQQSDLDLWCGFLSRNGIEQLSLDVHITQGDNRTLPVCIIYCPTIKQLVLNGVDFCLPVNHRPGSIFSGVTSLMFYHLNFDRGDDSPTVIHLIPYLEVLVFLDCHCIDSFVINAPRLKNLTFIDYKNVSEWKWFELHFFVIKTLCFSARTGMEVCISLGPSIVIW
ncbi:unnamed protein product [Cuscuta epithymum]|uniref:F-box domain-containing protein n=1 Tax=Cuscuta epithymum TaxID=186058 RepID=A0AAV0CSE0_9ASTE|nr:unnamed protein product [Cuscuta epithymum]